MVSGNIVHADLKLENILLVADETYLRELVSQETKQTQDKGILTILFSSYFLLWKIIKNQMV